MADDRDWNLVRKAEANALNRDWGSYRSLAYRESARFQLESQLDASGFSQRLRELALEGSLLPPQPPTLRGRLGGIIVRGQERLFWWVSRAFRIRDEVLRSSYGAIMHISLLQMERETELRNEISELRRRLEELEGINN